VRSQTNDVKEHSYEKGRLLELQPSPPPPRAHISPPGTGSIQSEKPLIKMHALLDQLFCFVCARQGNVGQGHHLLIARCCKFCNNIRVRDWSKGSKKRTKKGRREEREQQEKGEGVVGSESVQCKGVCWEMRDGDFVAILFILVSVCLGELCRFGSGRTERLKDGVSQRKPGRVSGHLESWRGGEGGGIHFLSKRNKTE
jgi:hypothetical protein